MCNVLPGIRSNGGGGGGSNAGAAHHQRVQQLQCDFLFPALPEFVADMDGISGGGGGGGDVIVSSGMDNRVDGGLNGSAIPVMIVNGSSEDVASRDHHLLHHQHHHQNSHHHHQNSHHHHQRMMSSTVALELRHHHQQQQQQQHVTPFRELRIPQCPESVDSNERSDAVHRNCMVCNAHMSMADLFTTRFNSDGHLRIKGFQTTALHAACTHKMGAWKVKMLCANGAKVNEPNLEGQTPLHLVLLARMATGDWCQYRSNIEECLETLLMSGADVNARDKEGESPLLYVRTLLNDRLYDEAATVADVLLRHGANPNAVNAQGRTLLTYSVYHLDDSVALSRLLLNHGASVWPIDEPRGCIEHAPWTAAAAATDAVGRRPPASSCPSSSSPFSWFLKSVIAVRRLENCSATVRLLSHAMGERPKRMHAHVLRTMFRHVRCFRVLGPVFLQLKLDMMRYWSEPQDLKYLCWRAVRRSVGSRRLVAATPHLGLPRPLQRYILME